MSVRSMVVPLDEMQARAVSKGAEAGKNLLDWFFANEVPSHWRLAASSMLLQPSKMSALLNPGPPQITPVFYFFFEEEAVIQ